MPCEPPQARRLPLLREIEEKRRDKLKSLMLTEDAGRVQELDFVE